MSQHWRNACIPVYQQKFNTLCIFLQQEVKQLHYFDRPLLFHSSCCNRLLPVYLGSIKTTCLARHSGMCVMHTQSCCTSIYLHSKLPGCCARVDSMPCFQSDRNCSCWGPEKSPECSCFHGTPGRSMRNLNRHTG